MDRRDRLFLRAIGSFDEGGPALGSGKALDRREVVSKTWCVLVASALVLSPVAALAQDAAHHQDPHPQPTCTATENVALPSILAAWANRSSLVAASDVGGLSEAELTIGVGVDAGLPHASEVVFPVPPTRAGEADSRGGLFVIPVETAGDYQVSLGERAWIEVVRDGAALKAVRFGPGPACSGLRKTVTFALTPGRYVLEIAGADDAVLPLMVTRAD